MSRPRKEIVRGAIISVVVSVGVTIGVTALATHHDAQAASQEGSRGFWTASQKANAAKVLTSPPVLESGALAQCVIEQVSQERSYADFLEYARMAALNDFNNPSAVQADVINSLMFAAWTCPEKN